MEKLLSRLKSHAKDTQWRRGGVRIGFLISLRVKPDLYGFTAHYDPVNNQYKLVVA